MTRRFAVFTLIIGGIGLPAQHRADPKNLYERLICVVPMIGAGTHEDPRRPLFAPVSPPPPRFGR